MAEEFRRIWSFIEKAEPAQEMLSVLVPGEEILQCYKTNRDMSALTNKRIIIFDRQGLTGKKIEIYSIPYRSIDMWSTENAGKLFDIDAELELWIKSVTSVNLIPYWETRYWISSYLYLMLA